MNRSSVHDLREVLRWPEGNHLPRNDLGHFYASFEVGKDKPYHSSVVMQMRRDRDVVLEQEGRGRWRAVVKRAVWLRVTGGDEDDIRCSRPAPYRLSPLARHLFEHCSARHERAFEVSVQGQRRVTLPLPTIDEAADDIAYWEALAAKVEAVPGRVRVGTFELHPEGSQPLSVFSQPMSASRYDF